MATALPVVDLGLDYDEDLERIRTFLTKFKVTRPARQTERDEDDETEMEDEDDEITPDDVPGVLKYRQQLQRVANREQERLVIDLEDLNQDLTNGQPLVDLIKGNTQRYVKLFSQAVDEELPAPTEDIRDKADILDVIQFQRMSKNDENEQDGVNIFPANLLRRYNLYFRPLASDVPLAVREVRGSHLGKLITVRGIVTRVSEVKPLLQVNAYTCDSCGAEIFQDIDKRKITPLTECISEICKLNNAKGQLHMQTRACKFTPFQECKIQEMTDQVPVGHIPRSMTIHLYGNQTRLVSPGDVVHIGGVFLPIPYEGFKALKLGLLTDSYLEAHHIHQLKKQYESMKLTPKIYDEIAELKRDPALYSKLASSIAPEIFGHEDVKKALLLLLVGGVTKSMGDGMRIRGDLNVCLMGDPGVAKSQLLKYISKVAPRGVYTTGRGSSGVGLTAAVMRDPVTDEFVLEGGALVLADNGIACIDEFDKMDESDRTAIHEVMEQQTISISKAGITTTLNARTSILAAANPLYGRYNPKISPVDNINLPAALLSRFDLLFLILDTPSRDDDQRLAEHVTYVHMHSEHPPLQHTPISPVLMRHYIALVRQKRPTVPRDVSNYVVQAYVSLRKETKAAEDRNQFFTYTSARTLLGVLRLSQALARLRFADAVETADVDEALRLMECSKASLHDHENRDRDVDQTTTSKIFTLIKTMAAAGQARVRGAGRSGRLGRGPPRMEVDGDDEQGVEADGFNPELNMREVRERVIAKGFTEDQFKDCLDTYAEVGVWQLEANETILKFLGGDD
ncbi:BQ5605_C005g03268 [Microbotryum silenes-dioicae]|uniref:DNA replication licensing factor MCM7 n=1 Tax=Microbotryum silenes-dioicae TaxID=796604 RepID=A0A2X0PC40_9BASI|nr:BQ5605_C005g03268 [Microbotryum silenes-dioicae]